MKLKLAAVMMALVMAFCCAAALAEDDSDWAALFTDNTWATNSESTSSSSPVQSSTKTTYPEADSFWNAITAESSQPSTSQSATSQSTSSGRTSSSKSSSSSGRTSAGRSVSAQAQSTARTTSGRVGELGDDSVSLSWLVAAAAACMATALFARYRRTAQR
ncbi:MAG: hypothetical protein E7317_13210 [Clostridiales bacterium]|nr:hypothetical protein [Clostridiales bacterium]